MKHPTTIEGKDLQELAKELGNLRYDVLMGFLTALAADLQRQSEGDRQRGRLKLATALHDAAEDLYGVASDLDWAWSISEPYMREE